MLISGENIMNFHLNAKNYHNLRALINYALQNMPDEQLTEELLNSASWYNSFQYLDEYWNNQTDS